LTDLHDETAVLRRLAADGGESPASPFNIGVACADRHPASRPALLEVDADRRPVREVTYGHLATWSNQLAHALRHHGVERGDRVAVVLPQGVEAIVAHLGVYKSGAVLVPLTVLFGPDAIRLRVSVSEARVVITDRASRDAVVAATEGLPGVQVLVASAAQPDEDSFWALIRDGSAQPPGIATERDSPALMIFTSGTTGDPKGALHAQRVLLGHLPSFEYAYDAFSLTPRQLMWTPADWAWIGGMFDAAIPTLYHGRTLLAAAPRGFDPEWAAALMAEQGVTTSFLPPTALRMMERQQVSVGGTELHAVITGGETLTAQTLEWGRGALHLTVNEMYGQTEANFLVGNSSRAWPVYPGKMGRAYPGHRVAVLDDHGDPCPPGELGEIALRLPDPVVMLGYWSNPAATAEKTRDRWLRTGDWAKADENGYLTFWSRRDDIINSSGYRIGPSEIEKCLATHDHVLDAVVVGVPDELRGQVVKAFVVTDAAPSAELAAELQGFVRTRLGNYQYPRSVEFVGSIPTTTTGKRMRRALIDDGNEPTRPYILGGKADSIAACSVGL
jgi:acetyl-CoA synthetase